MTEFAVNHSIKLIFSYIFDCFRSHLCPKVSEFFALHLSVTASQKNSSVASNSSFLEAGGYSIFEDWLAEKDYDMQCMRRTAILLKPNIFHVFMLNISKEPVSIPL